MEHSRSPCHRVLLGGRRGVERLPAHRVPSAACLRGVYSRLQQLPKVSHGQSGDLRPSFPSQVHWCRRGGAQRRGEAPVRGVLLAGHSEWARHTVSGARSWTLPEDLFCGQPFAGGICLHLVTKPVFSRHQLYARHSARSWYPGR